LNWSNLQQQYQRLSLLTDTLPKKIRKEVIEARLNELETFIALLEKHPVIVIMDNARIYG
jgi:hypothetical protein